MGGDIRGGAGGNHVHLGSPRGEGGSVVGGREEGREVKCCGNGIQEQLSNNVNLRQTQASLICDSLLQWLMVAWDKANMNLLVELEF